MPKTTSKNPAPSLPIPGLLSWELAAAMRCTPRTLAVWEREGKLPPSIRVGRKRVWRHSDVAHLLASASVIPSPAVADSQEGGAA